MRLFRIATGLAFCFAIETFGTIPFQLEGPGVNPANFRVTAFATGLNYPLGMAELPDGSILVASTDGPGFFGSNARLVRLIDADQDGVADAPAMSLFQGLSGGLTSVRIGGRLVFVTGQTRPIYVLRLGTTPGDPFTQVGRIDINYPGGGWLHPHSALAVRPTPGTVQAYDLLFQIGSKANFAVSTQTASITSTGLGGLSGTLRGDSIYMLTFIDNGTNVMATNLLQIASGLRNPSGFAFDPGNGDLYFEDNGIDGLMNPNEPHSADELNFLTASAIGGTNEMEVEFFGFPTNYTAYRTGNIAGGLGVQPLIAFQPQPDPFTGEESEGPNDIAFSPPAFPDELNKGVFVAFHGKFSSGGANNEENPLVFVSFAATNYFHLIKARLPGVGHLDGLLPTRDSLFVSDLSTNGSLSTGAGKGVVYQIKALVGPSVKARWVDDEIEVSWKHGVLQSSMEVHTGWQDVTNVSPYTVDPAASNQRQFFRARN